MNKNTNTSSPERPTRRPSPQPQGSDPQPQPRAPSSQPPVEKLSSSKPPKQLSPTRFAEVAPTTTKPPAKRPHPQDPDDWEQILEELTSQRAECNERINEILREMMKRRAGYSTSSHEPIYNLQLELDRLERQSGELTDEIRKAKKQHVAMLPPAKLKPKSSKRARRRIARQYLKQYFSQHQDGSLMCQWYSTTDR